MTNREWLESLDNDKLAENLADFAKVYNNPEANFCKYCVKACEIVGCCTGGDRADAIKEWLKAEHKEDDL